MKNIVYGKKYKTRDGTEKTQWIKIGVLGTSQSGREWIRLESIPVGWDGMAQVFEQEQQERPRAPARDLDSLDDDVPFR